MEQEDCLAAQILQSEGLSRLDVLNYVSHGITRVPMQDDVSGQPEPDEQTRQAPGEKKTKKVNPLEAFTINLLERAAKGKIDPLVGRQPESARPLSPKAWLYVSSITMSRSFCRTLNFLPWIWEHCWPGLSIAGISKNASRP